MATIPPLTRSLPARRPHRLRRQRPVRGLRLAASALLVLALAACGSQLEPETVAQAGGAPVGGAGVPGEEGLAADGSVPGGDDTVPGGAAPGSTSTGPGGTASGGDAGADTGGGGTEGSGENAADGGVEAGSCDGFENTTGITDDKIVLANISDISGPVPGIFESAQQATRAYAAYFNSGGDICGRKLEVLALDSRSDAGGDQQAYAKACDGAFAAVGSMSAFDSGGAGTAESCGLPDIRSTAVTPERNGCATCFSAQSVSPNLVPSSMPKYWLGKAKQATQHVGLVYINVGAAAVNAQSWQKAWTEAGWKIDYFEGIDVSEFNYAPYVQQMKDKGIEMVVYTGPYQNTIKLQQAMKQQGFEPEIFLQDATIYDANYVEQAGADGDGAYVYSTTALFDDMSIEEMKLYRSWLDQVSPGAVPNYYGLYAWSAARLFVQQAVALGGRLDRKSLVEGLSKVRNWTGNGLHAPQQVGAKTTTNCVSIIRLEGGTWSQVSPGGFLCGPLIDSGVGG
ncbi:ABC transporter substrate-binding protein [Nocardioides ferulae]|uniref:ABC transporter substrate-binding protein n=1 Tax=Nocardioides ferulae TaxID=2340821 RepID=UPI000F883372|nr:ABC transporter substrate-binding protein [Nocardioides ferulae]